MNAATTIRCLRRGGVTISGGNFTASRWRSRRLPGHRAGRARLDLGTAHREADQRRLLRLPPFWSRTPDQLGFMMARSPPPPWCPRTRRSPTRRASTRSDLADKEDHVSMGCGQRSSGQVASNVRRNPGDRAGRRGPGHESVASPLASSAPLQALHGDLRRRIAAWDRDREMAPTSSGPTRSSREIDRHLARLA